MANSEFPTYFITPVLDRYLVYAPLHQFSVILDEAGVSQFENARSGAGGEYDPVVVEILQHLSEPAAELEFPRGKITSPLFLGFITTRGCNMKCKYCDFVPSGHSGDVMEFALARSGIDAYLRLLTEMDIRKVRSSSSGANLSFGILLSNSSLHMRVMRQ
jgi:sulfatase maturation enzyme AslB (radical SAM superfamily)